MIWPDHLQVLLFDGLGMNTTEQALEIWQRLGHTVECRTEIGIGYQVLHRVQSGSNRHVSVQASVRGEGSRD